MKMLAKKIKQKSPVLLWIMLVVSISIMFLGPKSLKYTFGLVALTSFSFLLIISGRKDTGFSILGIVFPGSPVKRLTVELSPEYETQIEMYRSCPQIELKGDGPLIMRWPTGSIIKNPVKKDKGQDLKQV